MSETEIEETGPIDYLVVEFPADVEIDGSGLAKLRSLVERDIIRILDLVFVRKGEDGLVSRIPIQEVGFGGDIDVSLFAEAASDLFDDLDVQEAGATLRPATIGILLAYENHWAADFAVALRKKGGQLVSAGRVPVQAILARLDELEAPTASS